MGNVDVCKCGKVLVLGEVSYYKDKKWICEKCFDRGDKTMERIANCMYDYRREHMAADEVDICVDCEHPIFEGEPYYDIKGETRCESCMENYRKIAEK